MRTVTVSRPYVGAAYNFQSKRTRDEPWSLPVTFCFFLLNEKIILADIALMASTATSPAQNTANPPPGSHQPDQYPNQTGTALTSTVTQGTGTDITVCY